jgi:hypothetical protein
MVILSVKTHSREEPAKMLSAIGAFLKPSRSKVLLFSLFIFISIAGYIQSYAFSDGEQFGIPKPMFYDVLRPIPFWPMWMYLLLPFVVTLAPISLLGIHIPGSAVFLPMSVIYLYVLASFLVFSYDKYRSKFTRRYWAALVALALGINLLNLLMATIAKPLGIVVSGGLTEVFLVGILSGTFVIILYGYLLTCIALHAFDAFRRTRLRE